MTPNELRVQFLSFCGPEKFRKFAQSLVKLSDEPVRFDRLRYWQEILWAHFREQCPDAPENVNEIGSSLHWCDLHDASLIAGTGHQLQICAALTPSIMQEKAGFLTGMVGRCIIVLNAELPASNGFENTRLNVACFNIEFMMPIGLQCTKTILSFGSPAVMRTCRGTRFELATKSG